MSINDVEVSRTSLKLRNPENKPDEWEMTVLKQFEDRKAKGESPKKIEHSEVVDSNGEKYFRYMKAIAIGETCLNCHGEKSRHLLLKTSIDCILMIRLSVIN